MVVRTVRTCTRRGDCFDSGKQREGRRRAWRKLGHLGHLIWPPRAEIIYQPGARTCCGIFRLNDCNALSAAAERLIYVMTTKMLLMIIKGCGWKLIGVAAYAIGECDQGT